MASVAQRRGRGKVIRLRAFRWPVGTASRLTAALAALSALVIAAALASYRASDPSLDTSAGASPGNWLGLPGAAFADLAYQTLGLAAWIPVILLFTRGALNLFGPLPEEKPRRAGLRVGASLLGAAATAGGLAGAPPPAAWPMSAGLGGMTGDSLLTLALAPLDNLELWQARLLAAGGLGLFGLAIVVGPWLIRPRAARPETEAAAPAKAATKVKVKRERKAKDAPVVAVTPEPDAFSPLDEADHLEMDAETSAGAAGLAIKPPKATVRSSGREAREIQASLPFAEPGGFRLPELIMLTKPKPRASAFDEAALRQNAQLLETVLGEFGVRGQIDQIRPGPVVTLYELVPAAGVKSARVVALSDDIARSMSVAACRVSVVPGRNAIGIELPNLRRETVYLRDLLSSAEYEKASQTLPLALGETIGGEPYIADLARMPHLLIAGTTGSGKSVGVNAMILSILYRLPPEKCRFIMIDPKMLELSIYDGIPHLLAPVVTDPKKAIVALKWTVREMEDRYRRMSKIGVRNVAGYNDRANEALAKGEHFVRTVQTGFDENGRPIFEEEKLRPEPMPYLVVVIDEVADLMMVAGKDIEGAVQRLAQMARAAGIHLIMATQRPSVDVITGTIKANFPTRISFQVTSKIDSRTIMGEQGAEQLLGMGDMLYMAGGGRITRLHGPYVDDEEVIKVAKFLREQGEPQYLDDVTAGADDDADEGGGGGGGGGDGGDLYDQAVAVVTRDRKASTSYIQRRLQIGYNRAASLMERMEQEGVVGAANHAGKRDVLAGPPP